MREQDGTKRTVRVLRGRHFWRGICPAAATLWLLAFASLARAQQLTSPVRIAEGPPGQLLVSDYQQDTVFAVDKRTLNILWSFGVAGSPLAVAQRASLVFIGNESTHNVEVYRLKGNPLGPQKTLEFLFNLGHTPTDVPGFIQKPTDMAFDKDQELVFVLDGKGKNIKVFDIRGNFLETIPPEGGTPLLDPTGIAVDEVRKEFLVSDYGDPAGSFRPKVPARVMIYTYGGLYLDQIAGNGPDPGFQFPRPQGLAVDAQGRVFIADALLGKVFVFDRAAHSGLKTLGSFGEEPGQLKLPLDVVIDQKSGDVFVTNYTLGRIEVFRAGATHNESTASDILGPADDRRHHSWRARCREIPDDRSQCEQVELRQLPLYTWRRRLPGKAALFGFGNSLPQLSRPWGERLPGGYPLQYENEISTLSG